MKILTPSFSSKSNIQVFETSNAQSSYLTTLQNMSIEIANSGSLALCLQRVQSWPLFEYQQTMTFCCQCFLVALTRQSLA
ncbi:Uncharacterised protein [Vibrio cholerae]|nr:Uncharacterised protein [Vibrio cholerae]CSC88034.1 Uncharacterised protein [Vibrio cholerae]CSI59874.1 Uncharacterised protein [Vibrio cholerae]